MAEAMNPSDVLIGIGYNLPEERKCFIDKRGELHTFFCVRKSIFPEVLGRFNFSWDGPYPGSRELNDAISTLAQTGLLGFCLNDPGHYQFDEEVKTSYERFVSKRISQEQAKGLILIAAEFDLKFGERNRYS